MVPTQSITPRLGAALKADRSLATKTGDRTDDVLPTAGCRSMAFPGFWD